MNEGKRHSSPSGYSLRVARIAGIEIRLDLSVVIIFALIVFSLAGGVFPAWHEDWGTALTWGTALVSGILFFVSLLAHEMAHSLVAQRYGIPVPRITLFLLGGMAETGQEPDRPWPEFLIAIAGPLMSVVISLACSALVSIMVSDPAVLEGIAAADAEALAQLGPVETGLLWLGSINMILAVFNMIPGFPMDGGRVFRAIAWAVTGDKIRATRWASTIGRVFGWTLMALGVLTVFGGNLSGLWWILIGWFISNLARMSMSQLLTEQSLKGFRLGDLMNTRFDRVRSQTALADFIDDYLLRSTQQVWPVEHDGRVLGFVLMEDVTAIDPGARSSKTVDDVMRPLDVVRVLDVDTNAREALEQIYEAEFEPVPVMRRGELVGLIQRADIFRWMSLHQLGRL